MTNQHPITTPPELVQQWINEEDGLTAGHIATKAAQWGADQELDACCEWLDDTDCEDPQEVSLRLRWHRRPKPPIRKEQALEAVSRLCASVIHDDLKNDAAIVRRALEALPND